MNQPLPTLLMSRDLEIKIYSKNKKQHFGKILLASFKDMYQSRFLAKQLTTRDIKALYRQSFLGIFWAFIIPFLTAFVWILLNHTGTVKLSDTGIAYPVYAFTGTLLWSIVSEAINAPTQVTNASKGILSKINFPKEALIISGIYKLLFNTLIKVVLLGAFIVFYGVDLQVSIVFFPLVLLVAVFFGTTIGLLIAPVGVLYKDVSKVITIGLQFLMYVTPVVYAVPKEGFLKTIMELNPITPIILTGREVLTGMEVTYLSYFFWVVIVCIPLFLIGLVFYRISIPIIVERVSG